MGASPDGVVKCDCFGSGVLEIKCPFSCKNKSLAEAIDSDGQLCLTYFYQVQAQIKLTNACYCDFVVWSPDELAILRIEPDDYYIAQAFNNATAFFKYGLLPELVGKWYTKARLQPMDRTLQQTFLHTHQREDVLYTQNGEAWCYCRGKEEGEMIFCENYVCPIGWFHTKCLKISIIPKGKWYCPDCRVTMENGCKSNY